MPAWDGSLAAVRWIEPSYRCSRRLGWGRALNRDTGLVREGPPRGLADQAGFVPLSAFHMAPPPRAKDRLRPASISRSAICGVVCWVKRVRGPEMVSAPAREMRPPRAA